MIVLDPGAVTRLAERSTRTRSVLQELPLPRMQIPLIPSVALVECLHGDNRRDVRVNRLIKACDIAERLPLGIVRRAAQLRTRARRGSAVDAIVVAAAEPGGVVLTQDPTDIRALAAHADGVAVLRV